MARLEAGGGGTTNKGKELLEQAYKRGSVSPVKNNSVINAIQAGAVAGAQAAQNAQISHAVSSTNNVAQKVAYGAQAAAAAAQQARPQLSTYQRLNSVTLPKSGGTLPKGYYPQQYQSLDTGPSVKDLNISYRRTLVNNKTVRDYEADLKQRENELKALSANISNASSSQVAAYNSKVKEYEREYGKYVDAVEDAQNAAKEYQDNITNYGVGSTDGMLDAVKRDYNGVRSAANDARMQAAKDTRTALEDRKKSLQAQRDSVSFNTQTAINQGKGASSVNAGTSLIRQYDDEIASIDNDLASLGDWQAAFQMENAAKIDPNFAKYVEEGEKKIEEARDTIARTGGNLSWFDDYRVMTDEQKAVYAYYYGKNGNEKQSVEYKDKIQREINQKLAQEYQERVSAYAEENPVQAGLASIFVTPVAAAYTAADMVTNLANPDDYNRVADPNTKGGRLQRGVQAYREEGLNNIDNSVLRTLAEAGYSVADMIPAIAANAVAPGLGTAYMGALGGTSSYADAANRGLTNAQALQYGAVSGAVSTALEKVGLDKIGEAFAGGKKPATQLIRQVLGSFMSEGSEEAAENLAQVLYDQTISGSKSEINQAIQEYMAQGMSRSEAEKKAWSDFGADTLQTFIVGGLAGGILSGAGGVVNNTVNSNTVQQLQDAGLSEADARALVNAQRPATEFSIREMPIEEVPNSMTEGGTRMAPATPPASVGDFADTGVSLNGGNVNNETQATIEKLSSDLGVTTVFDDTLPDNVNGYYDTETGEIHINPNSNVNTVFSHELTHSLENTKAYQKLRDLVLNELGDEAETLRQQKTELYNRLGKELDVDSEIVADYISQNLFTDANSIRRVVEADRSLATRIKNWITRMVAKVTGKSEKAFLMRAEDLYNQALNQSGVNTMSLDFRAYSASESKEVQRLEQQNSELRRQMTRTTVNEPTPNQVKAAAKQFLDGYSSKYASDSLVNDLNELYVMMGNRTIEQDGRINETNYEMMRKKALQIADNIIQNSEVVNETEEYSHLRSILKENPVYVDPDIRSDIEEGYSNFRKKHQNEIAFSQEGMSVDELWKVLNEEFPGLFPEDVNEGDMLNILGDILDSMKPTRSNPFTTGNADLTFEKENLATALMERFFSIPQKAPTFADKQAAKLVRAKIDARKAVDAAVADQRQKRENLRQRKNERIDKLERRAADKVKKVRADEKASKWETVDKRVADQREKRERLRLKKNERIDTVERRGAEKVKTVRAEEKAAKQEAVNKAVADQRQKREALRLRKNERIDVLEKQAAEKVKRVRAEEKAAKYEAVDKAVKEQREMRNQLRLRKNERIDTVEKRGAEKVKKVRAEEKAAKHEAIEKLTEANRESRDKARDSRNRRQTRERISDHVKALSKKLLTPTNTSHIPDELTKPVASLLEAVNMESTFSNVLTEDGKLKRVGATEGEPTKRTQAFRELREAYTAIQQNPRWANSMVVDPDLQANIDAVIAMKDIPIMSMNQQQLNTVWEAVAAVEHSVSTVNKSFTEGRYKDISTEGEALIDYLKGEKTKQERVGVRGMTGDLLNTQMLNPYDMFHEMGKPGDDMYRRLRAAEDMHTNSLRMVQDFMRSTVDGKTIKKWKNEKSKTFKVGNETINLNTPQRMYLYLLNQREQGRRHIYGAGIEQGSVVRRGKVEKSYTPVVPTEAEVNTIVNSMTPEQKKVADALGRFLSETLADMGNEVSLLLYGYRKFTDNNYITILVDKNYVNRNLSETGGQGSIENKGFTKSTNPNAINPVIVGDLFDIFLNHVGDMTAYHAWVPVLKDTERIYNYRASDYSTSVSAEISRALGKGANSYIATLMEDINGRANLRNDFSMDRFVSNFKKAAVGANLRVVIQQPSAYPRAMAVVPAKYLAKGVFTPKKWELVKQWAPIAQWKDWGYFELNTGRQLSDVIMGTDSNFEKFQQGLMAAAGKADEITWTRLWSSCEWWVRGTRKDLTYGSDAFYREVANRFNEVIDRTQVVDSVLHRSQLMRSPNPLNKMASAFMSEPTKTYNLLRTAWRDYMRAPKSEKSTMRKKMGTASVAFLTSSLLNASLASLVDALRDDDKDETYLEKWNQAMTGLDGSEAGWGDILSNLISGNIADNLNILNMIPYAKDALSIMQGWDVERMDMAVFADFWQTAKKFMDTLEGGSKNSLLKASGDLVLQMSRMIGVPAANLARDVGAVVDTVIRGIDNPVITYHYDQLEAPLMKNKGIYYDLLWDTVEDGDKDAYKVIRDDMLEQGITLDDIRSALVERYKAEWETDPSIANNSWIWKEAGITDDTIAGWKKNAFKKEWEADPNIANDKEAMKEAGVKEEDIQKWEESKWKESGYLEDLKRLGADIDEAESVVKAVKGLDSMGDKRAAIRNSALSDTEKAVLYRTIASGNDKELLDQFAEEGKDVGKLYVALDDMANVETYSEKRTALLRSGLADADMEAVMTGKGIVSDSKMEVLDDFHVVGMSTKDFLSVYSKYDQIYQGGQYEGDEKSNAFSRWLDQQPYNWAQAKVIRNGFKISDKNSYDKLKASGLSPDEAAQLDDLIQSTMPDEGTDDIDTPEAQLAVAMSDANDEDKLLALSVMMSSDQYSKVESAYSQNIPVASFVKFDMDTADITADKDENGKSINGSKKAKIMAYIDSMNLTIEQKDYLYEEAGYALSTIDEAPWYGGEKYTGKLFDDDRDVVATSEPLPNAADHVTQNFGNNGHTGVDIGWSTSPTEDIVSYEGGTVIATQTGYGNMIGSTGMASYGNMVQILYDDGTTGLFAHLSNVDVKEGDRVEAGQKIGNMGDSGNAYGNHLHYEMRDTNGNLMDPIAYMENGSVLGGTDTGGYSSTGSSGSKGSSSGATGKTSGKTSGKSSGSSSKGSTKKLSTISLPSPGATRDVPKAEKMSTSNVIKLSLPTVRSVSKAAITSSNKGITVPEVGGIESRNSSSADVRFITP